MNLFPAGFDFTFASLLQGLLGIFLIIGVLNYRRPLTKEEVLQKKILDLKQECRLRNGQFRHQQGVIESLHISMKRLEDRHKKDQLTEARLRGELARRERQIRSLEFELQQERNKPRGRRKK